MSITINSNIRKLQQQFLIGSDTAEVLQLVWDKRHERGFVNTLATKYDDESHEIRVLVPHNGKIVDLSSIVSEITSLPLAYHEEDSRGFGGVIVKVNGSKLPYHLAELKLMTKLTEALTPNDGELYALPILRATL